MMWMKIACRAAVLILLQKDDAADSDELQVAVLLQRG